MEKKPMGSGRTALLMRYVLDGMEEALQDARDRGLDPELDVLVSSEGGWKSLCVDLSARGQWRGTVTFPLENVRYNEVRDNLEETVASFVKILAEVA